MSAPLRGPRAVAIAALCLLLVPPWPVPVAEPPLTNEDIVRMVAAGRSEREIVEMIGARAEAFDLSDDMVEELKQAGVTAPVLTAMRRKHDAAAPPPQPADTAPARRLSIVVTLNESGAHKLQLPAWADEDAKARFQLPKENEQRHVSDVAVFLACVQAEHIPDQWRTKSPLGRDMIGAPRHEMLAFVPGETPAGSAPRIVLPAKLEGYVDGAETHDILLGVAALIGDHWVEVAAAHLANVNATPDAKPLEGRIKQSGHGFAIQVELAAAK